MCLMSLMEVPVFNSNNNGNENEKPNPFANLAKALSNPTQQPTQSTQPKPQATQQLTQQKSTPPFVAPEAESVHVENFEQKQGLDALEKYQFESQPETFSEDHVAVFHSQLQKLRANFQTQEVHNNLLTTLAYLKSHSELKDILKPEDINTMVQALQISYGATIEKRQSNKAATSKRKQKQNDIESFMADMMI